MVNRRFLPLSGNTHNLRRGAWRSCIGRNVDGFAISRIEFATEAEVPGIDAAAFQKQAEAAKAGCPVSKALAGTEIHLTTALL